MQEAMRRLTDDLKSNPNAIWVFCGDSITHGAYHTQGKRDYVELVEERVRYELSRTMNIFVNTGISGDMTPNLLATLDQRALRLQPNVFSLMIGMNDCVEGRLELTEFEKNLDRIIERVRTGSQAHVILQTCCAIAPAQTANRARYPQFMEAVRRKAAEHGTALVDHLPRWEKVRREEPERYKTWMSDSIHPNGLGHWMFAEQILTDMGLGTLQKTQWKA